MEFNVGTGHSQKQSARAFGSRIIFCRALMRHQMAFYGKATCERLARRFFVPAKP
jgi:hypothetical protein